MVLQPSEIASRILVVFTLSTLVGKGRWFPDAAKTRLASSDNDNAVVPDRKALLEALIRSFMLFSRAHCSLGFREADHTDNSDGNGRSSLFPNPNDVRRASDVQRNFLEMGDILI